MAAYKDRSQARCRRPSSGHGQFTTAAASQAPPSSISLRADCSAAGPPLTPLVTRKPWRWIDHTLICRCWRPLQPPAAWGGRLVKRSWRRLQVSRRTRFLRPRRGPISGTLELGRYNENSSCQAGTEFDPRVPAIVGGISRAGGQNISVCCGAGLLNSRLYAQTLPGVSIMLQTKIDRLVHDANLGLSIVAVSPEMPRTARTGQG